tara:strand:- start:7549 stop:7815 length:267 start_codon:yes stop_codon:yes gene_type:complete
MAKTNKTLVVDERLTGSGKYWAGKARELMDASEMAESTHDRAKLITEARGCMKCALAADAANAEAEIASLKELMERRAATSRAATDLQ